MLISRAFETSRDVLVPRDDTDGWELWSFSWEGALAHASFAELLRWQIQRSPHVPTEPGTEDLVSAIRRGEVHRLHLLSERGHPDLVDLAIEVLDDEELFERCVATYAEHGMSRQLCDRERILRACHVLYRRPDPRAIEPLCRAYRRAPDDGAVINALAALGACGAPDAVTLLADAAARHLSPHVRAWAARRLEHHRG